MECTCWNKAIITGDIEKLKKIESKFLSSGHTIFNNTNFYKLFETNHVDFTKWGSDRFTPYVDLKDNVLTILGDSNWSPMVGLFQEICKDFSVSCVFEYEEVVYDFAGRIIWNENGEVIEDLEYRYWEKLMLEDEDRFWSEFRDRCQLYDLYDSIISDMHLHNWKDISILDKSKLEQVWDEYIQTKLDRYIS